MEQLMFELSLSQWLFMLGIGLLVIEIAFLGFATFVLFFVGLAMLVTGGLMAVEILPQTINSAVTAVSLLSISSAILLWKPLKKIQSSNKDNDIEVGLVGHRFQLETDISPEKSGEHAYSGITWKVVSDQAIAKAAHVKVVKADVGQLTVMPANKP
ncbi:MAG: NfeD family protein [Rhodospirillaceae bacterium]|nr:NfeD family protein [Rhodospirillaceae bacterium]MBT6305497.1 NfeD family protein [Rhodospirillaceae bacterium]